MKEASRPNPVIALLSILMVVYALGFVGSHAMNQGLAGWYQTAKKPIWAPPTWLFVPLSTVLYGFAGFSAWLIWREQPRTRWRTLSLLLTMIGLAAVGTACTFQQANFTGGCIFGCFEAIFMFFTLPLASRWSKGAAVALLPFALWRIYLVGLTVSLLMLNGAKVKS